MNYSTLQATLKNYRESDARLALYIGKLNSKKETLEAMLNEVYYQASMWCSELSGSFCSIPVTLPAVPQGIPALLVSTELIPDSAPIQHNHAHDDQLTRESFNEARQIYPLVASQPRTHSSLFTRYNLAVALYAAAIALTALLPY